MKMAACSICRTVHEAVGSQALIGADEERTYRITHCRLCKSSSAKFRQLPDQPDLADDELGYPMAVVPWLDTDSGHQTTTPRDKPGATVAEPTRSSK